MTPKNRSSTISLLQTDNSFNRYKQILGLYFEGICVVF